MSGYSVCNVRPCLECLGKARKGQLKEYFVSLEESVVLCDNDKCSFIGNPSILTNQDSLIDDIKHILDDLDRTTNEAAQFCQGKTHSYDSFNESKGSNESTEPKSTHPSSTLVVKNSHCSQPETLSLSPNTGFVMLWSNIDALCWLDVLLCMLCHNNWVRKVSSSLSLSSVIKKLLLTFDEAQELIAPLQQGESKLLQSVMELNETDVKRGGGFCMDTNETVRSTLISKEVFSSQSITSARRKLHLACIKMECAREEIWQAIEPKLRCKRGSDDSPVFALPIILNMDPPMADLYSVDYCWTFECSVCQYKQIQEQTNVLPTFPRVPCHHVPGSSMTHLMTCSQCSAPNQKRIMSLKRISDNLAIHFVEGLGGHMVDLLSFTTACGREYQATAIIEYKVLPNHFIIWQKDNKSNNWMVYNDLVSQYGQFSKKSLSVPPESVHIVFWECTNKGLAQENSKGQQDYNIPTQKEVIHSSLPQYSCSQQNTSQLFAQINAEGSICDKVSVHNKQSDLPTQMPSKPKVSLLTEKRPLNTPLKKPNSSSSVSVIECPIPCAKQSYSDIMGMLGVVTPPPTLSRQQSVVQSSGAINQNSYTPGKTAGSVAKSYLDIVKPLLEKNKQKKSACLGGYVPISQREETVEEVEDNPSHTKRKKVMFTSESCIEIKRKSAPPKSDDKSSALQAYSSRRNNAKSKRSSRVTHIIEDSVYKPPTQTSQPLQEEVSSNCDMPSFDELLAGMF